MIGHHQPPEHVFKKTIWVSAPTMMACPNPIGMDQYGHMRVESTDDEPVIPASRDSRLTDTGLYMVEGIKGKYLKKEKLTKIHLNLLLTL